MANLSDWNYLRNGLRSLDNQVKGGEVVAADIGPPWDLPADLTGDMARDYITAADRRMDEVEGAIKRAMENPIERVQNAGRRIGFALLELRKRELKIAKELGHAAAESAEKSIERLEKSGESIATGLGMGAAFAAIVLLLLVARGFGK